MFNAPCLIHFASGAWHNWPVSNYFPLRSPHWWRMDWAAQSSAWVCACCAISIWAKSPWHTSHMPPVSTLPGYTPTHHHGLSSDEAIGRCIALHPRAASAKAGWAGHDLICCSCVAAFSQSARPGSSVEQDPDPVSARQWPLLSSWRWLVQVPSRHAELTSDVAGHSASAVLAEGEGVWRIAASSRWISVMPYCGRAVLLLSIRSHPWMIWPWAICTPQACILTNWQTNLPRHLRGEFVWNQSSTSQRFFCTALEPFAITTRMSFFISCVKLHMHQPEAAPHPLVPAAQSPSDRFSASCSTPAGQGVLQQLPTNKSLSHGSRLS